MDAKKDVTPEIHPLIKIRVGGATYSVNLCSTDQNHVGFRPDTDTDSEAVGDEIIRLCELGYEAEKAGLKKEDMPRIERHFTIKPRTP